MENIDFNNWIIIGIPFIFLLGCLFHFIYALSGNMTLIGIISPVNESVWEHLKLAFYPILIWGLIQCCILNKFNKFNLETYIISLTISILAAIFFIISFYYIGTGAFNIHSVVWDIFSFFLSITFSQLISIYIYENINSSNRMFSISLFILLALAFIFTVFTFIPPKYPIFKDSNTGKYGI